MRRVRRYPTLPVMAALAGVLNPAGASPATAQSTTHDLPLVPANVHWGFFDARVPPVLRIRSGDRVRVETMVARGLERPRP